MATEKWTKKKIFETSLELIPKINAKSLSSFLVRVERQKKYFSKSTFYNKIKPGSKEYKKIVEAIEDNKLYLSEYGIDKLKVLVDSYNLRAIEDWLKLYGDDETKQAFTRNYNINANANVTFEQEMKKVEEDLSKFSKEELLQYRALRKKLLNNE